MTRTIIGDVHTPQSKPYATGPPSTMSGSMGVAQARPRLVGKYLGEGNAPGVHVYDVLIHDLKRALR